MLDSLAVTAQINPVWGKHHVIAHGYETAKDTRRLARLWGCGAVLPNNTQQINNDIMKLKGWCE